MFFLFIGSPFIKKIEWKKQTDNNNFSVIILTETQGFVHHNAIKEGKKLIDELGMENNFSVFYSNKSELITKEIYEKSDVIVFLCTTLDVLEEEEQTLLVDFIQKGGGFVGIHSAADTEYDWEWYGKLVGAYFKSHPEVQNARIKTENSNHISTSHLDKEWSIKDEWYNYKNINPDINILLTLDEKSYKGGENGENHPITWYHDFDGGRSFYTGLGHDKQTYQDERFKKILLGGLIYAAGKTKL